MVMDIRKKLQKPILIIPNNFCSNIITKKSFPGTHRGQCPTPGSPRYLDFTQMVLNIRKQLQIPILFIPNYYCFNNIAKNSFPGTHRGQFPTPGIQRHLDFTQMVLDVRKQLQIPILFIPNYFFSTTLPKNQSLGHTVVNALLLAVGGAWTSPRCSWTSGNNFKYLFYSSPTTVLQRKLAPLTVDWPRPSLLYPIYLMKFIFPKNMGAFH